MKLAANVVAAMAWGLFLALVSYPFFAGGLEHPAQWATAVLMSFLVGLIVPSYLLRLENVVDRGPTVSARALSDHPQWTVGPHSPRPKREDKE